MQASSFSVHACAVVASVTALLAPGTAQAQLVPNPALTTQGPGLSVAIGGVGMANGRNGDISVVVNGPVQSAYLYWNGDGPAAGAQEMNFGGVLVAGTQIGSEVVNNIVLGYRADVTAVVQASFAINGPGTLTFNCHDPSPVDNLDRMHGAGLMVIYTDPTDPIVYDLITCDGLDYAWSGFVGPNAVTQPVTFTFASGAADRNAELMVFVGEGTAPRPDRIDVSGNPSIVNALNSSDGAEWDSDVFAVVIAGGSTSLTVEVVSPAGDLNSDSLVWQLGALRIPVDQPPGGGEGCTPGYWKQPHHFDSWPAPFTPNMPFASVFENAFPGKTLLQVLKLGGGGLNALGRHTVAALLNSASPNVNYNLSPADVIAQFNAVFPGKNPNYESLKNVFEAYNEQGCPLN